MYGTKKGKTPRATHVVDSSHATHSGYLWKLLNNQAKKDVILPFIRAYLQIFTFLHKSTDREGRMEKLLFGVSEAAELLSLSVPVLRLWIRQGKLPCVRAGRRVLLHRQVLEERAASGTLVPPPTKKARTALRFPLTYPWR